MQALTRSLYCKILYKPGDPTSFRRRDSSAKRAIQDKYVSSACLSHAVLMRLSYFKEKRRLDSAALTDRAIDLNVEADVKPGV